VHQHLDGTFTITHGPQRLGHYSADAVSLDNNKIGAPRAVEKTKSRKQRGIPTFPQLRRLREITHNRTFHLLQKPDILICYQHANSLSAFEFPWA